MENEKLNFRCDLEMNDVWSFKKYFVVFINFTASMIPYLFPFSFKFLSIKITPRAIPFLNFHIFRLN